MANNNLFNIAHDKSEKDISHLYLMPYNGVGHAAKIKRYNRNGNMLIYAKQVINAIGITKTGRCLCEKFTHNGIDGIKIILK